MSSFDTHQTITKRLKELSEKLASTKLSQHELEEFEALARSIYERAVILNYKAKEAGVYGKSEPTVEMPKITPSPKKEEKKEELSTKPREVEFDFSGDFGEVEPENTPEPKKPIVEKEPEPVVVENTVKETRVESPDKVAVFNSHFLTAFKNASMDKLSNAKINSLKGAFGLNDKLLFIRELFDGSADEFNQVIDVLEAQNGAQEALKSLSKIATERNWDKEDNTMDEFAHIVIRRYVD